MSDTEDFCECQSCHVKFQLYWQNDGISEPEYCPFCGTYPVPEKLRTESEKAEE